MEINFISECGSTQDELVCALKSGEITPPFVLCAASQTKGIGSRGNVWESVGGNLYFSCVLATKDLPSDLPVNSASIYFAFLMKEYLNSQGSAVWLKWPNDFYLNEKKIGGVITTKIGENFICGMGINLRVAPEFAGILDVQITPKRAIIGFIKYLEKKPQWKQIFSKYLLEFEKSRKYEVHVEGAKMSLNDAILCPDGSISINDKKVYSNR